jgi:hypothetical protein
MEIVEQKFIYKIRPYQETAAKSPINFVVLYNKLHAGLVS